MPQGKRKTAEEILGIAPRPRKSAEEILGIAPKPAPAQEPVGAASGFQTGLAGPLLRNVVETAADFYNAPGETLERAGRGALEFFAAFDPAGNAYKPTVEGQAARVAELNRRADERLPEPIKSMKAGLAIEEAKPRTRAGRIASTAGAILGEVAFPTAPETAVANIVTAPFGGAAVKAGAKVVAPVLRRIRAGRNVGAAVAETPVTGAAGQIRATGAVAARQAEEQAAMRAPQATRPQAASSPTLEGPQTGRVVTVGDDTYRLTPEQEARWVTEVDEPMAAARRRAEGFDPQTASKIMKGRAMEVAKKKREIVGALTPKEQAAITAREATNYKGKQVTVDVGGQRVPATVEGTTFGRIKVRLDDGQAVSVDPSAISARVQAPAPVAPALAAPIETPGPLPVRQSLDAPPMLEVADDLPFEVSLGKERARTPGATGPKFDEAVELELRKQLDSPLGTKAERTPILETISALRKAGLLTGLKTHIKNVGGTGAFQVSEELARIPGAIADMIVGKVTGRRTLTGPSLSSMGRSAYSAATDGIAEAKKALRTGKTRFDEMEGLREIASGSKVIDAYVNGVFRTLKAEDAVFRTYALRRSLEDRARAQALNEARKGTIPRGEIGPRTQELLKKPPADMEAAALLDAEVATFNNSNVVSDALSAGIQKLPKGGQFIVDQIVPFRKTPTNVIARMLESSPIGFGKNAVQLARGIAKKSFTEAEQRAFSQTFGRASLGSGLIALGYIGYRDGWLTGLQEDEQSRKARDVAAGRTPGSIKVGDTWHQLTGFAPFGSLLAIGATLARETAQEQEGTGALPALEVAGQAIGEQPFLIGTKQVAEALAKPGSVGEKFLGGYLGSTVPTAVSDVAEAFDPTQREATGVTGRLQSRIPGVRNTLPAAQDVLGQPRQDYGPGQAFLDPTRATTDVASTNQLFAELVRLDVGLSGFDKEKDEPDESFSERARELGSIYLPAGQQLVSSQEYARASDEVKREAVKILNRRAKFAVKEGRNTGNLLPASVMAAAVGAVRKEATKKTRAK